MSVVWTKEMAGEFLAKSSPDPLFPCSTLTYLIDKMHHVRSLALHCPRPLSDYLGGPQRDLTCDFAHAVLSDEKSAYDALGRCKLQCANCNCRMLFNQLECVKADLETTNETLRVTANELDETMEELHSTKETLQVTANELDETMEELHSVKCSLEECNAERNEEKRKFASVIAKMVQSDVRTQLSALNLCLKEELGEKALEKKAASEAAKAALSASKDITLRLLMF